ncbi:hypothetical protein [Streptomyces sp. BRA346]|uniref:hypothetical protein n=1 Tax=Streptomyces sp. BRA346 TaxID=2878199 RepID=UPI004062CB8B
MSVGQAFSFTAFTTAALDGVPQRRHGVAGASNVTAQQAGAGLGTAILVAVASAVTSAADQGGEAARLLVGYHVAYLVASGVVLLEAVAIAVLPALGAVQQAQARKKGSRRSSSASGLSSGT